MRIGELAAASGVPVSTIKYYLREGLLAAGERTAPNQADYGPEHLGRLRLVRALVEVGGLGMADVRRVVIAMEAESRPLHEQLLLATHRPAPGRATAKPATPSRTAATRSGPQWRQARALVRGLVEQRGWRVGPRSPALDRAADAVAALLDADLTAAPELCAAYADAAQRLAEQEVAAALTLETPADVVRAVAVGSAAGDALFSALRLLARIEAAGRLLAPDHPAAAPPATD